LKDGSRITVASGAGEDEEEGEGCACRAASSAEDEPSPSSSRPEPEPVPEPVPGRGGEGLDVQGEGGVSDESSPKLPLSLPLPVPVPFPALKLERPWECAWLLLGGGVKSCWSVFPEDESRPALWLSRLPLVADVDADAEAADAAASAGTNRGEEDEGTGEGEGEGEGEGARRVKAGEARGAEGTESSEWLCSQQCEKTSETEARSAGSRRSMQRIRSWMGGAGRGGTREEGRRLAGEG